MAQTWPQKDTQKEKTNLNIILIHGGAFLVYVQHFLLNKKWPKNGPKKTPKKRNKKALNAVLVHFWYICCTFFLIRNGPKKGKAPKKRESKSLKCTLGVIAIRRDSSQLEVV